MSLEDDLDDLRRETCEALDSVHSGLVDIRAAIDVQRREILEALERYSAAVTGKLAEHERRIRALGG